MSDTVVYDTIECIRCRGRAVFSPYHVAFFCMECFSWLDVIYLAHEESSD